MVFLALAALAACQASGSSESTNSSSTPPAEHEPVHAAEATRVAMPRPVERPELHRDDAPASKLARVKQVERAIINQRAPSRAPAREHLDVMRAQIRATERPHPAMERGQ